MRCLRATPNPTPGAPPLNESSFIPGAMWRVLPCDVANVIAYSSTNDSASGTANASTNSVLYGMFYSCIISNFGYGYLNTHIELLNYLQMYSY